MWHLPLKNQRKHECFIIDVNSIWSRPFFKERKRKRKPVSKKSFCLRIRSAQGKTVFQSCRTWMSPIISSRLSPLVACVASWARAPDNWRSRGARGSRRRRHPTPTPQKTFCFSFACQLVEVERKRERENSYSFLLCLPWGEAWACKLLE